MTIKKLNDQFSVSGALSEQDFTTLVSSDVSLLINVRPDNESPEQISSDEYLRLCKQHAIDYVYIPVSPCQYSDSDVQKMAASLASSKGKVHCFCRTGARAAHMWALANKKQLSFEHLQSLLSSQAYDLNVIADKFK